MLYIYSANVKEGHLHKLQEWAKANEGRVPGSAPTGWKFAGIYAPTFGFGDKLVEIHWNVENYAAFDHALEAASKGGDYPKLIEELFEFLDVGTQSARLLKRLSDSKTLVVAK